MFWAAFTKYEYPGGPKLDSLPIKTQSSGNEKPRNDNTLKFKTQRK
jgi:hypothetical protein